MGSILCRYLQDRHDNTDLSEIFDTTHHLLMISSIKVQQRTHFMQESTIHSSGTYTSLKISTILGFRARRWWCYSQCSGSCAPALDRIERVSVLATVCAHKGLWSHDTDIVIFRDLHSFLSASSQRLVVI